VDGACSKYGSVEGGMSALQYQSVAVARRSYTVRACADGEDFSGAKGKILKVYQH
jgi:hypothetical protein